MIGEMVRVVLAGNVVVAKVVSEIDTGYYIYVTDKTGGYHAEVPKYSVLGLVKQEAKDSEEEISKPKRYNKVGKLECWDVIIDQKMDFLEGSVMKYLWRHKEKNGAQDLKKAVEYLNKMIAEYENLYGKK